jgi:type III restriction enzyme
VTELFGQAKVIADVRALVDAWRGFPLGSAAEPYPSEQPRYEVNVEGEHAVSATTQALLRHWFRREPHEIAEARSPSGTQLFKYWPHQRRTVETFIYLYEARGIRRTEHLYELAGVDPMGAQRDPWAKLGGQLATGSGKTKMMSLLIAWAHLNAIVEGDAHLGIGRHALLIAPGLFVRDRLLIDFEPPSGTPSVFFADPIVPPELAPYWCLKVYSPTTCPKKLDPNESALVVTNFHQLLRDGDTPDLGNVSTHDRQMNLLFEDGEPEKLEGVDTPLIDRFTRSKGLLVINDEAHHVWDETGHARFEEKAKQKPGEGSAEMAWIRSIRRLNGSAKNIGRVALQVDMSATLFEEQGAAVTKGKQKTTVFKPADLFRHTVVNYSLAEAIKDGIVKKPVLERPEVKNAKTGEIEPLIRDGQPNAWEVYRNLLVTGIERWKKVKAQLDDEGDTRKPILFILCNDRKEAKEVANFLKYGEAVKENLDGVRMPTGYLDPLTNERLFVEDNGSTKQSTVVEIHIGEKEEKNEEAWEHVRAAVNAIDRDVYEVVAEDGTKKVRSNPFNVVVSVLMIKEGWDVRNVKVIVPLRPCDSRTLTEQTLGRGLRKMYAPELDDDGAAMLEPEELYVIEHPSFRTIIEQVRDIIEEKTSGEIEHSRNYVRIDPRPDENARRAVDTRIVRFEGLIRAVPDWRKTFDVNKLASLAPRLSWKEEIADTEIQTFLKAALQKGEQAGQTFILPSTPSYKDFDHVVEQAYALPLLRELRAAFQHKTAVKGVVQEFLERKTFAVPAGVPISFSTALESGAAKIVLGNLARAEVIEGVKKALQPALHDALTTESATEEALLQVRLASELRAYQAIRKNVFDTPKHTAFVRAALGNQDELRASQLLDLASDCVGWVYNHRSGVGFPIEYDWQGFNSKYYPDFVARAQLGVVFHNFIIEVKGRFDDRDRVKARRGARYCELLSQYDVEPWHYILLLEDEKNAKRADLKWWEALSTPTFAQLLRRHENLPLLPFPGGTKPIEMVQKVADDERFRDAAPVHEILDGDDTVPGSGSSFRGWARVQPRVPLDTRTFLARVPDNSMSPGVVEGSWGLFRLIDVQRPASVNLDMKRMLLEFSSPVDGKRRVLRRWRVRGLDGLAAVQLEAAAEKGTAASFSTATAPKIIAELVEVVG